MAINPSFATDTDHTAFPMFDPNNGNADVILIVNQDGTAAYFDPAGNPYVPSVAADLTRKIEYDREAQDLCFTATAAGTGYAIGDRVVVTIIHDIAVSPAVEVSRFITNVTTGVVVAVGDFVITNFEPCGTTPSGIENLAGVYFSAAANAYYTGVHTFAEDGTYSGITFYDDAGGVVTPADATLVGSKDIEQVFTCLEVVTAGADYAIGDRLTKITFVDAIAGVSYGAPIYFNITQDTILAAAPAAGETQVCADNEEIDTVTTCRVVTTAGTGYALGDQLQEIRFINVITGSEVGAPIYYNETTSAYVTLAAATDTVPCPSGGDDVEVIKMLDYDSATRARIEFLRKITTSADGTIVVTDVALDGTTAYTVTGTAYAYHQRFSIGAGESIAFSDAAVVALAPPAGADVAEIHVWGGGVVWDKRTGAAAVNANGTVGFGRHADGAYFELEGADEIAAFQLTGLTGEAGRIEVSYVEGLNLND